MYDQRLQDIPEPQVMQEEIAVKAHEPMSRQYYLREYPINIEFLSIGCIVRVGCKSIPFTSIDDAMKEINAYVADPYKQQQRWRQLLAD
jgi:hypothetical protein